MVKTAKKNKRKKRNNTRRTLTGRTLTGRTLTGGTPTFIEVDGKYKNGKMMKYTVKRTKMNKKQQEGYAKKHKVFYPLNKPSRLSDILDIDIKKMKFLTRPIFSPSNPEKNRPDKEDYQTVSINNKEDIENIEITNKIIKNIIDDVSTKNIKSNNQQKYDNDIPKFIQEYKNFIKNNKSMLLKETNETIGWKLLNTPIFLNKIGTKYGFISAELPDLEELQKQMDAPPIAKTNGVQTNTNVSAVNEEPAIIVPEHIRFSKRLKQKIADATK